MPALKRSQLNIAIPPDLLAQLRARANHQGLSMSALVLQAIRELLNQRHHSPTAAGLSVEERLQRLEQQVQDLAARRP